jgi:hypothetical protein
MFATQNGKKHFVWAASDWRGVSRLRKSCEADHENGKSIGEQPLVSSQARQRTESADRLIYSWRNTTTGLMAARRAGT